jgi:hypothetical protein
MQIATELGVIDVLIPYSKNIQTRLITRSYPPLSSARLRLDFQPS